MYTIILIVVVDSGIAFMFCVACWLSCYFLKWSANILIVVGNIDIEVHLCSFFFICFWFLGKVTTTTYEKVWFFFHKHLIKIARKVGYCSYKTCGLEDIM